MRFRRGSQRCIGSCRNETCTEVLVPAQAAKIGDQTSVGKPGALENSEDIEKIGGRGRARLDQILLTGPAMLSKGPIAAEQILRALADLR
jgi:hypothetical protein